MNKIHPTAIIEGNVNLGINNEIGPYTVIYGPTTIGDNNLIGPHVTIGTRGQDTRNPRYDASMSFIEIGNNNIIGEYTAIQKPCYRDITKVGNNVYLMQGVCIPHDAILEDDVVVTPMIVLAGITQILQGASIGIGCTIHQYTVIGQYAMVGMGSALRKNIKPFSIFVSGKPPKVNDYAVEKFNFLEYQDEINAYVIEGKIPKSDKISILVEKFEKLHKDSRRPLYL